MELTKKSFEFRFSLFKFSGLVDNYDVYIAKVVTAADPCSDTFGDVDSQAGSKADLSWGKPSCLCL